MHVENKLNEITKLLKSPNQVQLVKPRSVQTCWDDTKKLAKIKAPMPKPQLVIKKSNNENQMKIEETLINNKVQKLYEYTSDTCVMIQ